ncbi:hypothetical protein FKM82_028466 [Ascaphus truei]
MSASPPPPGDSLQLLDVVPRVEVRAGGRAELRCGIRGTPPVAASWVRNKKQVADGPRISVLTSDTESRLVIRAACEDDAGCYTLCARDRSGSTQHHTSLAVVGN